MTDAKRKPAARVPAKRPVRRRAATSAGADVSSRVIAALVADFRDNGAAAIQRVREKSPEKYLALIGTLLPRMIDEQQRSLADAAQHLSASAVFGPLSETADWLAQELRPGAGDPSEESVS